MKGVRTQERGQVAPCEHKRAELLDNLSMLKMIKELKQAREIKSKEQDPI